MKLTNVLARAIIGKPTKPSDPSLWRFAERMNDTGVDKALRISTVWACVRLLSETIATLPIAMYQRESDGSRKVAREHSLHPILSNSPNELMTSVNFWESMISTMLLTGNAYARIRRLGGRIVSLEPIPCRSIQRAKNGLDWDIDGEHVKRTDVLHIPAFTMDGITGLSPIKYGAGIFNSATSAEEVASSTFRNGLMKTVAFKVDRVLKPEQREEFRKYVESVSGALNAGQSPVLESGVTPEMIGIDPSDAQLLESRAWSVEEICRFFGVPPHMVGHTEKTTSWGSGIEQQMIGFLTFTLTPWLERIEQALNKNLLTPTERIKFYAEYSVEALLRADSAARAEFYGKMVNNGIYTRDECRTLENKPRRGGNADKLTVQSAMTTLDSIGAEDN